PSPTSRPLSPPLLPYTTLFRSGRTVTSQRLLHSFYAEVGLQRDRHPPCQDAASEPVQHGGEVNEPARHGNVGDVHRPDLIGPVEDRKSTRLNSSHVKISYAVFC